MLYSDVNIRQNLTLSLIDAFEYLHDNLVFIIIKSN